MDAQHLPALSPAPQTLAPEAAPPWPVPAVPALSASSVMRVFWGIAVLFVLSHIIVAAFVLPTVTRIDAIPRYLPYALAAFDVVLFLVLYLVQRRKQRKHDMIAQGTHQAWARLELIDILDQSSTISGRVYQKAYIGLHGWLQGQEHASTPIAVELWLPQETVARLDRNSFFLLRRSPKANGYTVQRLVFADGSQLDVSNEIMR